MNIYSRIYTYSHIYSFIYILNYIYTYNNIDIYTYSDIYIYVYFFIVANVNLMAAHRCDSVMADTNLDRDSGMTDSNLDEYNSEVELKIATAYVQLCIEYVQKYYMKRPMCTSILSGKSYVIEVLEGNSQV